MSNVNNQPIPTLFVSNLESKVKKDGELRNSLVEISSVKPHLDFAELKRQLYALFVPYGKMFVDHRYRSHRRDR